MKNILVSGGAGYIGSHMVLALINQGHNPIVIDNFSRSTDQNLKTVKKITGKDFLVINQDITKDLNSLDLGRVDAIINFAAFKAIEESVEKPLEYYSNNIGGNISLLNLAKKNNVKKYIFSSTAAVYGEVDDKPIKENSPTKPTNPYASSKLFSEQIIKDTFKAFGMDSVILRYFNVAGNIESGEIGDTQLECQNLIPSMMLSHLKIRPNKLQVRGTDYPTRDGTGIRDYIHVLDLIDGHLKALEYLDKNNGSFTFNLGTGKGTSVMEIINSFEKVTGEKLDYEVIGRRAGDVATVTCDASLAEKELGWKATRDVDEMIRSMWKWYKSNYRLNLPASR